MFVTKVVAYCLVLINLSLGSKESTTETSWYYKRGGLNITLNDELLRKLFEEEEDIRREYEMTDIRKRMQKMKHKDQKIPDFFDARKKWPMCESLFRVKHQLSCAACWAFASAGIASDRLCIASKGRVKIDISVQDIVTCCEQCYENQSISRCKNGASLVAPMMSMIEEGVLDAKCKPYNITTIEDGCKKTCVNETMSYRKKKFNLVSLVVGVKNSSTLQDVQIEIMKYGPVSGGLGFIPYDFMRNYTNEVYIYRNSNVAAPAGHAIKIVGWGTENRVPYWLCANSWGKKWGKLEGFFKIRRGTNELQMERFFMGIDTDTENQEIKERGDNDNNQAISKAIRFTKLLQLYKITIFVLTTIL